MHLAYVERVVGRAEVRLVVGGAGSVISSRGVVVVVADYIECRIAQGREPGDILRVKRHIFVHYVAKAHSINLPSGSRSRLLELAIKVGAAVQGMVADFVVAIAGFARLRIGHKEDGAVVRVRHGGQHKVTAVNGAAACRNGLVELRNAVFDLRQITRRSADIHKFDARQVGSHVEFTVSKSLCTLRSVRHHHSLNRLPGIVNYTAGDIVFFRLGGIESKGIKHIDMPGFQRHAP